jgi:hypothetical protein
MYMKALLLFMLLAIGACTGTQPLKVHCNQRLVPINDPQQIGEGVDGAQPARKLRR